MPFFHAWGGSPPPPPCFFFFVFFAARLVNAEQETATREVRHAEYNGAPTEHLAQEFGKLCVGMCSPHTFLDISCVDRHAKQ